MSNHEHHATSESPRPVPLSPQTYVRWQQGASRFGRAFPPLDSNHEMAQLACPVCSTALGCEQPVVLFALGPEPDTYDEHRAGRWYTAVATVLHEQCATAENADAVTPRVLIVEPDGSFYYVFDSSYMNKSGTHTVYGL